MLLLTGRQFDSEGNLKEWWNNETIEAFREQTACIIDQYTGYRIDSHRINGKMTQGENIGNYVYWLLWDKIHKILTSLIHM